jgi:hypothetical protein
MKKFLIAATALSSLVLLSGGDAGAADLAAPSPTGGWFGSITGAYIFEDPTNEWQLFGPNAFGEPSSESNIGDGGLGRAVLGYRWSDWDVAAAVQYGSFGDGNASTTTATSGTINAEHFAVDAQFGFNTSVGNSDVRMAFGARYAEWDHDVDPGGGRSVSHDFAGIGPMVEFDSSSPISGNMTLEFGAIASVLFGDIETSSSGGWICTDCSKTNTTAFSLEGDIGVGFNLGSSARAVLGWQAQWWDGVNVAITDDTNFGGNTGKSGHLVHGPFLSIEF